MVQKNVARGASAVEANRERPAEQLPYRKPEVRDLGGLEQVQGRYTGREYDGPGRYYFNGF